MTVMFKSRNQKVCVTTFLLLMLGAGCSDSDQRAIPGLTPPTATSVAPPNNVIGACSNTIVTATFGEAMNPATINGTTFMVSGPGPSAVTGIVTYNASSNTAIFTSSSTLALNTAYTGTITTGAKDSFGIGLTNNFVWTFTTGNTTCQPGPPTVISVAPPNAATGICPNTVVVATFSDAMNPSTIDATTFTLTGPSAAAVALISKSVSMWLCACPEWIT